MYSSTKTEYRDLIRHVGLILVIYCLFCFRNNCDELICVGEPLPVFLKLFVCWTIRGKYLNHAHVYFIPWSLLFINLTFKFWSFPSWRFSRFFWRYATRWRISRKRWEQRLNLVYRNFSAGVDNVIIRNTRIVESAHYNYQLIVLSGSVLQ